MKLVHTKKVDKNILSFFRIYDRFQIIQNKKEKIYNTEFDFLEKK